MAKVPLTKDSEFIVGEEKVMLFILSFLCLALFIYGVVDAVLHRFTNLNYVNALFALALIPAIVFFQKGRSNKIYIRVNKTGIYQDEKLVTAWASFLGAKISQKEKPKFYDVRDNFILVVEYRGQDRTKGFRRKIPLTNTQNKSEEEVLEAVKFFWNEYRKETGW